MIFSYLIMRHCDGPSSRGIRFKCETRSFELPLPYSSSPTKKEDNMKPHISKQGKRVSDCDGLKSFNFAKSSFSIAGLCFTFSFPWRFKLMIWVFNISFDLLKRGSELSLRPRFKGGVLRYLSKECRKRRRVDLLYGSPDLFLASA